MCVCVIIKFFLSHKCFLHARGSERSLKVSTYSKAQYDQRDLAWSSQQFMDGFAERMHLCLSNIPQPQVGNTCLWHMDLYLIHNIENWLIYTEGSKLYHMSRGKKETTASVQNNTFCNKCVETSWQCQRYVLQYLTSSVFVPHLKLNNMLITWWSIIITLTALLLVIIMASTLSFSYASIYTYYIVMMKTH